MKNTLGTQLSYMADTTKDVAASLEERKAASTILDLIKRSLDRLGVKAKTYSIGGSADDSGISVNGKEVWRHIVGVDIATESDPSEAARRRGIVDAVTLTAMDALGYGKATAIPPHETENKKEPVWTDRLETPATITR